MHLVSSTVDMMRQNTLWEISKLSLIHIYLIKTNMEVIQHNSETLEMLKQEILMEKYLEEERRRANES